MGKLVSKVMGNGVGLIESSFATFNKIKEDLSNGIQMCQSEIAKQEEVISKAKEEQKYQSLSVVKAEKLLVNLTKFLEG
jgi:hypothetical protein